jgi:hypothetical protein
MSREEEGDPDTDVWHKNECRRLELKRDGHSTFKCFTLTLTFKNRVSYIKDERTATIQMLHFIYFFQQL